MNPKVGKDNLAWSEKHVAFILAGKVRGVPEKCFKDYLNGRFTEFRPAGH
jgi:hypothetical protein